MTTEREPRRAIAERLRAIERAIGAERPGRSPWVWLVPVFTLVATFLLLMFAAHPGELDLWSRLPAAIVGSLFLGGMSAAYLAAFAGDARDQEEGGDDPPRSGPPVPDDPGPVVGRAPPRAPDPRGDLDEHVLAKAVEGGQAHRRGAASRS